MSKENGQGARPKTSAEMTIQGNLRLRMSPEKIEVLSKGETITLEWGGSKEFNLQITPGPKDQIVESRLWFDADSTKLELANSVRVSRSTECPSAELNGYLAVTLRESADSELGISLTPAQAKALVTILERYVVAWEACEALQAPARA